MSQDPQMAGVVILLALVFLVLLVVRAAIEVRRGRRAGRAMGVPRINRWHRERAQPEGPP
jgi:hypothetical protein